MCTTLFFLLWLNAWIKSIKFGMSRKHTLCEFIWCISFNAKASFNETRSTSLKWPNCGKGSFLKRYKMLLSSRFWHPTRHGSDSPKIIKRIFGTSAVHTNYLCWFFNLFKSYSLHSMEGGRGMWSGDADRGADYRAFDLPVFSVWLMTCVPLRPRCKASALPLDIKCLDNHSI